MQDFFEKISQNKNFLMFITSMMYILGLFAYFNHAGIVYCIVISAVLVWLIIKNLISVKIVFLWMFIFYFGFFNPFLRIKTSDTLCSYAPSKMEMIGQIVSIPNKTKNDTVKFFLNVSEINKNGDKINIPNDKVLISIRFTDDSSIKELRIGDYYKFNGKLSRPFSSTNPSQFSYANYLRNYKVFSILYVNDTNFHKLDYKIPIKWQIVQRLNDARLGILESHSKYLKSPNIEVLGGIVFGDDAIAPPDEVRSTFINSGLLHILAASGMNVAFIYTFLYWVLRVLKVPFKVSIVAGIFSVILYSLMTGLGASVVRAAIMLIFVLIGKLIDRDAHSISLLSFVALLMLIYNPAYINDVGFQLSFIVTFGILYCADLIIQYFKFMPKFISSTIFIPIIAQIWVVPIQMYYFNNISIYSVFANILTVPILMVISCGGFLSSVFSLIRPISDFVCKYFDLVLNPFLNMLMTISEFFASLPHSLLITTHPSISQVILYYLILILIVNILKTKAENKTLIKITAVMVIMLLISTINLPNKNLEIVAFDVQNGDSFLIKTPQNKYIIIDTGKAGYLNSSSKAKMIVLKYLRDKGIKHINSLVLTHFDSDHSGGAVDLLDNLYVDNVYVNSLNDTSTFAKQVYKKSNNVILVDGKMKIVDNNDFSVELNRAKYTTQKDSDNENSIVSLVKYGEFSMLFTGDAGVKAYNLIKQDLPKNITVLKVGHHGAKGVVDREMLKDLNPKISLISVGYNQYGHPNRKTLESLNNTKILRTDLDHSVKFVASPKTYKIYTYDSETFKYKEKDK